MDAGRAPNRAGGRPVTDPDRRRVLRATAGIGAVGLGVTIPARATDADRLRWRFETDGAVFSSSTVLDDTLFVGSTDGHLYAIAVDDGTERWRFETDDKVPSSPTTGFVGEDRTPVVFVGSDDGTVYEVDAETGTERWRLETDAPVRSSPLVADDTLVVGSDDGRLYAVSLEYAQTRWALPTDDAIDSSPTVAEVDGDDPDSP